MLRIQFVCFLGCPNAENMKKIETRMVYGKVNQLLRRDVSHLKDV